MFEIPGCEGLPRAFPYSGELYTVGLGDDTHDGCAGVIDPAGVIAFALTSGTPRAMLPARLSGIIRLQT